MNCFRLLSFSFCISVFQLLGRAEQMLMRTHSSLPDLQLLPYLIFFVSLPTSIICKNFNPSEFQGTNEHITAHLLQYHISLLGVLSHNFVPLDHPSMHFQKQVLNELICWSSFLLFINCCRWIYPQILCCNFH